MHAHILANDAYIHTARLSSPRSPRASNILAGAYHMSEPISPAYGEHTKQATAGGAGAGARGRRRWRERWVVCALRDHPVRVNPIYRRIGPVNAIHIPASARISERGTRGALNLAALRHGRASKLIDCAGCPHTAGCSRRYGAKFGAGAGLLPRIRLSPVLASARTHLYGFLTGR